MAAANADLLTTPVSQIKLPESCLRFLIHRMTDQSASDRAQCTANQCGRTRVSSAEQCPGSHANRSPVKAPVAVLSGVL